MSQSITSRYQITYRADEINLIIRLALRGESLGFLGLAGVGKSNIVNFLRDIQKNAPQSQEDIEKLRFPIVDATQWQGTSHSLWKMMLGASNQSAKDLSSSVENSKIVSISEEERTFDALQSQLQWLCQELKFQVMFVLDDFDKVLETGPLSMLERLNGLRSEGNRGFLSYLVFTKRLPHILGQNYNFENESKFYDLFRNHIYALEPYNEDDAIRMLQHLNDLANNPLSIDQLHQIYQLTGGHAQLLRNVFNCWAEEGASGLKSAYFASKPEVQQECRRILLSLHEDEQEVAQLVARGQHSTEHKEVVDHLIRRGLLIKQNPITWFSPLLEQFLRTYEK